MSELAAELGALGGVEAPPTATARLRDVLLAALRHGAAELEKPRSGYGAPVEVAIAAGEGVLLAATPAAAAFRVDPEAAGDRSWLLVAAAVARRMMSADVGPPSSIVAAWITHRHGSSPPDVSTASPSAIGALRSDSSWIAGPPAREIAPATPPPCSSRVLAALAIASTSSVVMSVSSTSIAAMAVTVPP